MANGKYQKATNNIYILQKLKQGNFSRKKIGIDLDLQPSTVTYATSRMLEEGLIEEKGSLENSQKGRKQKLLGLNGNYGCVMGIELLVDHFRAIVLNFSGEKILEESQNFSEDFIKEEKGSVQRFEHITTYTLEFLAKKIPNQKILGACIGIAGIISKNGKYIHSSWTQGLYNYDATKFLSTFCYPIFFENDANCAAVSKINSENDTCIYTIVQRYSQNEVPKNVPTIGIGMGIIIDGHLRKGWNSKAGEFRSTMYHGKILEKQLAISNMELASMEESKKTQKEFIRELIGNLFFAKGILDPRTIYLGGIILKWKKEFEKVLENDFPNEKNLFDKNVFTMIKEPGEDVKKGASQLLLSSFFNLPSVNNQSIGWEDEISPLVKEL
ncbi:MAG: ROK family protein [Sphaerochaetaceae bacterium]